jgi:PPP family 3-phenylpropionic acid transporter
MPGGADGGGAGKTESAGRTFWHLSTIEFLFWFATATGTYLTIYLQRQGFKPNQVGFINALNSTVAIVAAPLWGMIADRIRSSRKAFLVCVCFGAFFWALVPVSSRSFIGPLGLMYLIIPLSSFFKVPANSLMEVFVIQRCDMSRVSYGHARLWGSVGWTVMCLLLSFILPRTGVGFSFYLYGVSYIPLFAILWKMNDSGAENIKGRVSFRTMGVGRLFRNYYFVSYLFFALFINMPVNISMTFLPYLVDAVGGDTAQYGLVAGYKALLEVPTLLLMRPLRRKFPLPVAIGGAAVLYIVEALLYTRAGSLFQIIAIQTFHGLGGGLMIGAASNYIYTLSPEGLSSTSQTVLGAVNSIASIIGSMAGGILLMALGVRSFYIMISVMLIFALCYFAASLAVGVKVMGKPIPFRRVV